MVLTNGVLDDVKYSDATIYYMPRFLRKLAQFSKKNYKNIFFRISEAATKIDLNAPISAALERQIDQILDDSFSNSFLEETIGKKLDRRLTEKVDQMLDDPEAHRLESLLQFVLGLV